MPNRPKVRLINQNERKISWSVLILEKLTRSHLEKLFSTATDVKETKTNLSRLMQSLEKTWKLPMNGFRTYVSTFMSIALYYIYIS